jgi:hypothetical protein
MLGMTSNVTLNHQHLQDVQLCRLHRSSCAVVVTLCTVCAPKICMTLLLGSWLCETAPSQDRPCRDSPKRQAVSCPDRSESAASRKVWCGDLSYFRFPSLGRAFEAYRNAWIGVGERSFPPLSLHSILAPYDALVIHQQRVTAGRMRFANFLTARGRISKLYTRFQCPCHGQQHGPQHHLECLSTSRELSWLKIPLSVRFTNGGSH